MSRLQGETVGVVTGVEYGEWGEWLGYETEDFQAVVIPEGSDMRAGSQDLITVVTTNMKLLVPNGWTVPAAVVSGAEIEVRGELFYVDGQPLVHRSQFGTSVGGVEINLSTTPVA